MSGDEAELLAFKLIESAQRRWRMVNVPHLVALVRAGRPSSAATWSSDPTSMRGLIEVGIVRAGGLSNHPVELMDRARAIGPVSVVQHQYSLLHRAPETDGVLQWCKDHGVPFLAWSPLASGFLADGFDLAALTGGDLRRRLRWADPAVLDAAALRRDLSAIASGAGLSLTALAAGWVLAQGAQPIIGARTAAEAGEIAAFRPIPPELAAAAEAAADAAFTAVR